MREVQDLHDYLKLDFASYFGDYLSTSSNKCSQETIDWVKRNGDVNYGHTTHTLWKRESAVGCAG